MRVMLAGGVFRLSADELAQRQSAPEIVLARGLDDHGVDVVTCALEDLVRIGMARGVNVLHVHHLSRAAVVAALSPRSVPFVFTAHAFALPRRRREAAGLRVVMGRADATVCLSERERSMRSSHSPGARRLSVIPNAPDLTTGSASLRQPLGRSLELLFVGQLIDVKRVDRVIEALVDRPHLSLRLVFHNDHLRAALETQARDRGVIERVTFVGSLSGDELFSEYRRSDALVLPSLSEALPSVVLEALSTGLPVVASDVGGIREQVKQSGVLCDPDDDRSVGLALDELCAAYPSYAEQALIRAAEVRREYSVRGMVDAHLALYRSLGAV